MSKSKACGSSGKHKNSYGHIDPTVAGIDVGDKLIYVAIPDGKNGVSVKEFATHTPALRKIVEALKAAGVVTAVMESTGVYWIPLYEILEGSGLKPVLVDARAVKNVPSRKSDVLDCQWIQTLWSNGLLCAAYRPRADRLKLRSYVRIRDSITKSRQYYLSQLEKALQLMNVKLSSAVSDIASVTGLAIIQAIVAGERSPAVLADLRNDRCAKSEEDFLAMLEGNFQEEHVFKLKLAIQAYDFTEEQLKECDVKIKAELESYPDVVTTPIPPRDKDKKSDGKYHKAQRSKKNSLTFNGRELLWRKTGIDLTALRGVEEHSALIIFSELGGTDVSAWSSVKKFSGWLGLAPGVNRSGGKDRKKKGKKCANYITQTLRMCAMSAKQSQSYIGAFIRRICSRSTKTTGIKAGANKLAHQIYYMCKFGWQYHEKGQDHYEKTHNARVLKNLMKRARDFGLQLTPFAKLAS